MKIERNLSAWDRMLRAIAAFLIFGLWMVDLISGVAAIIMLTIAGLLIFNSLVGRCWFYGITGHSTCPVKKKDQ